MIKKFLKVALYTILTGCLCGLIVGVYQLGIQQIVKVSTEMYTSHQIVIIISLLVLAVLCMVFNFLTLKFDHDIDGSGIPSLKLNRRENKGNKIIDIPLLILNSYFSTFVGFTLGSEGPSVVLASKTTSTLNKLFKTKSETNEELAEGVGFGCAFLSPLAGICYSLEESLESKLDYKKLIKVIVMMVCAFIITSLINQNHLLTIGTLSPLSYKDLYVLPLLLIINLIVGLLFIKLMIVLRTLFIKHSNNKLIKFRSFPLFIIVIILNFFLLDFMQSGGKIVGTIEGYTTLLLVFGVLLLRFILTAFSGSGSVTGGLVIPIMALGAINGQIVSLICANLFGLSSTYFEIIALSSGLMLFALIIGTPITSSTLLFSTMIFFTKDILLSLSYLPFFVLTLLIGYLLMTRLFKQESLYEQMIEVSKKWSASKPTTSVN